MSSHFCTQCFRSFFHNRKADAATSPDTSASSDKKSKLPKNAQNLGVIFWRDMMKKMLFHSYRKNNPGKLHTVNVMGPWISLPKSWFPMMHKSSTALCHLLLYVFLPLVRLFSGMVQLLQMHRAMRKRLGIWLANRFVSSAFVLVSSS